MMIETDDGFVSSDVVARMVRSTTEPDKRTMLLDAQGKHLGTAFGAASDIVDRMCPIVLAAPGFSLAVASLNEDGKPIWVNYIPILAWRLEQYQNPVPVCLEDINLDDPKIPWTVIGPDGRVYLGHRRAHTEWYDQWIARGNQVPRR